jgi:hypothetical protein
MLYCKNADKSSSMINNNDIWDDNKDKDDSKQFIETFYNINKKNKKSLFKENRNNKILTVKIHNID